MDKKFERDSKRENTSETKNLLLQATGKFTFIFILLGLCFFLSAGTMLFWEAWLFIGIFFVMMLIILIFMVKKDPDLLRRRLKSEEKRSEQKIIHKAANIILLIIILLPGFDRRWNWSSVPIWLVVVSMKYEPASGSTVSVSATSCMRICIVRSERRAASSLGIV